MDGESTMNTAMALIAGAGDSRSYCMEAIELAREGSFEEARAAIKNAAEAMIETHEMQTDLIRDEMEGRPGPLSLLMVHAQDHLNAALLMRDVAEEQIQVYQRLKNMEERLAQMCGLPEEREEKP